MSVAIVSRFVGVFVPRPVQEEEEEDEEVFSNFTREGCFTNSSCACFFEMITRKNEELENAPH